MKSANRASPQVDVPPVAATVRAARDLSLLLASLSSRLRRMEAAMARTPEVDAASVAEVKRAIAEGRYLVDAGALADKLLESAEQLWRARSAPAWPATGRGH